MSLKCKRSVLSIKDRQALILRLEKEKKGICPLNMAIVNGRYLISARATDSEDVDHIVFQTICKFFVSQLNVAFLL